MKRRDTERNHLYANEVFSSLDIFDIQGLLKEDDIYKCGIEAYQVKSFEFVSFDLLINKVETARFNFCRQLGVPYYVIVASESTGRYRIYSAAFSVRVKFELKIELSGSEFLRWWANLQSFSQKKAMYNAGKRISESIIDRDLFGNSLSWGVNVDGFSFCKITGRVNAIFEKRICTRRLSYTIENYDPARFFHGTYSRSGDFPSWDILFRLAQYFGVPLILFTFDTGEMPKIGAAEISNIDKTKGISYKSNVTPFQNIFTDNLSGLKNWLSVRV